MSLVENLKRISVPVLAGSLVVCVIALYGAANSELMVNTSTLKSNVVYFVIVFLVLHAGVQKKNIDSPHIITNYFSYICDTNNY